jgi:hypothetical protein
MYHKDLALGTVLTAPIPATSGTSLVLNSGQGTYFPDPSTQGTFYVTACPANEDASMANAEILLVQTRSGDTFSLVTRAQKSTGAKSIAVGWRVFQGDYAVDGETLLLDSTSPPVAADADTVNLFARKLGGRVVPAFVGPSGIDSSLQPALWANSVVMWLPGTGTTAAIAFGVNWTTSATQAHPTVADTNIMTRIRRATYTTTTTAGNQSGVRSGAPAVIRNSGFFFAARHGILTYTATMQIEIGLNAASGAIAGEPSAINDNIAMTKDSGETIWQVLTRDTSAASKTSTGETTAAASNTNIYDFYAFCKPADTKITVKVKDVADETIVLDNTEKSSNLPTNATPLYAHAECRNSAGGSGSGVGIFLSKIYIEADN